MGLSLLKTLTVVAEGRAERLERAPKQYSWRHLWMMDRALVGVSPAGDSLSVIMESKTGRTVSRLGLPLDYLCAPQTAGEEPTRVAAGDSWEWIRFAAVRANGAGLRFVIPASLPERRTEGHLPRFCGRGAGEDNFRRRHPAGFELTRDKFLSVAVVVVHDPQIAVAEAKTPGSIQT
jgi:hypothetical protein